MPLETAADSVACTALGLHAPAARVRPYLQALDRLRTHSPRARAGEASDARGSAFT